MNEIQKAAQLDVERLIARLMQLVREGVLL